MAKSGCIIRFAITHGGTKYQNVTLTGHVERAFKRMADEIADEYVLKSLPSY
ncbi:hypothetical protein FD42_GL001692 [Lentilactobacillus hilgardii DSM 20176 = ATCC 8290]|nr:hypothetical protein FD42_GL001692 [Lentilactobacillus hilgardii DSM 20176 = ATCC 8290]